MICSGYVNEAPITEAESGRLSVGRHTLDDRANQLRLLTDTKQRKVP